MRLTKRALSMLLSVLLILSVFTIIPVTTASADGDDPVTVTVEVHKWVPAQEFDEGSGYAYQFADLYQYMLFARVKKGEQPRFSTETEQGNVYNQTFNTSISSGNDTYVLDSSWEHYDNGVQKPWGDWKNYSYPSGYLYLYYHNLSGFVTEDVDIYAYTWETFTLTEHEAIPATCTTAGNVKYYTSGDRFFMGNSTDGYTQVTQDEIVIPAAGHTLTHHEAVAATPTTDGNIEYWTCDTCSKYFSDANGEHEITQAETVVPATGVAAGSSVLAYSLILRDEIGLRFYINTPDDFDAEHAEVTFTWGVGDYQKSATTTLAASTVTVNGIPANYKADCFVAARSMTDTIHMVIKIGDDVVLEDDYSISQYCDEVTDLYADDDNLRKCLCDMLDYGDATQRHFGYKTTGEGADPAGDHIVGVDSSWSRSVAPASLTDTSTITSADLSAYGVRYYGSSMVLTSKTQIRLYFKKTGDLPTIKVNGKTADWYYNRSNSLYYIPITGISAKDIFSDISISFNDDDALIYNTAEYYNSASDDSLGATVHTILQRLYTYSASAKALLNN